MASKRSIRAIMFSDIIGYSKLMNKDEKAGLALLSLNRKIHKQEITKQNGVLVKEMGDGILAYFSNSIDAVRCARNLYILGQENNINLRFGIHEDFVNLQDGDIYGDGVNIASRIESLGIPNSIIFSKSTFKKIAKSSEFKTESLGEYSLKNIKDKIELFALLGSNLNVPTKEFIQSRITNQSPNHKFKTLSILAYVVIALGILIAGYIAFIKPNSNMGIGAIEYKENSIVVLPFTNSSNLPDQEYFSEGMTEEVMNKLFRIKELSVISRNTAMKYKDSELTTRQIASQLGVANVLEGAVLIIDDSVRISMKLIDGRTDTSKWSSSYNRQMKDIFTIQSEIAQNVAEQLKIKISQELIDRIEKATTENPEVWKLFMRSKYIAAAQNDMEKASKLLEDALVIEPNFAPAHAELGYSWLARGTYLGDLTPEEILEKAYTYLEKAKSLDPNYPITHVYLAAMYLWFNWDFKKAENEWNEFYRIRPSDQSQDVGYVDFLNASGRFEEAVAVSNRMLTNNAAESASWATGLSYFFAGQPEKAKKHFEEALELFPIPGIISDASRTFVFAEDYRRAAEIMETYIPDPPNASSRIIGLLSDSYYHLGQKAKATELLNILKERSEKSPVGSPSYYAAMVLAQMQLIDEAFFYLNRAYNSREVEMFWLNVEPPFDPLKNDPRWEELIENIGFPMTSLG